MRALASLGARKKTESKIWGGNGVKKQSSRVLGLSSFPHHFPPMSGTLFFFQAPKLVSALDYQSATFQHQDSGYSFRGARGSLYWFSHIQIPPKCWGWSNLLFTLLPSCTMPSLPSCLGHLDFLFNLLPSCTIALRALCPLA